MTGLFVTSSGTEIGKTFVACALIHQLRRHGRRVRALKPIISGYDPRDAAASDSGRLLIALGEDPSDANVARISPWRFAPPISPNMAARRAGAAIELEALVAFCAAALRTSEEIVLIEGAGGVMAPVNDEATMLDWMARLACPALLVVGSYLGSISHTLTAVDALKRRGVALAGVVVSESAEQPVPLAETMDTLARFLPHDAPIAVPRVTSYTDAPDLTALIPSP